MLFVSETPQLAHNLYSTMKHFHRENVRFQSKDPFLYCKLWCYSRNNKKAKQNKLLSVGHACSTFQGQ